MTAESETKLDGVRLFDAPGRLRGGAAFRLREPSEAELLWVADASGATVTSPAGSGSLIVRGLWAERYPTVLSKARTLAERALDVWAARGLAVLVIEHPDIDHLAWWREAGQRPVLRICGASTINFHMGAARAVVRNARGEVIQQPGPTEGWTESLRYYRRAQLSDDVMDALRNMWLALENLLSHVTPQAAAESDIDWVERALKLATPPNSDLAGFVPDDRHRGDAAQDAVRYFYGEARTKVFHSKTQHDVFVSGDRAAVLDMAHRLDRLTSLYLTLLDAHTGLRRSGGAVVRGGFDAMVEGLLGPQPVIALTNDPSPIRSEDTVVSPAGHPTVYSRSICQFPLNRPFLTWFLARFGPGQLAEITHQPLRSVMLSRDDEAPVSALGADGELELGEIFSLQVQMGIRGRNLGLARSFIV